MNTRLLTGAVLVLLRVFLLKYKFPIADADLQELAEAVVTVGVAIWGLFTVYKSEQRTATAQSIPHSLSGKTLDVIIANGDAASAFTSKNEVPQ